MPCCLDACGCIQNKLSCGEDPLEFLNLECRAGGQSQTGRSQPCPTAWLPQETSNAKMQLRLRPKEPLKAGCIYQLELMWCCCHTSSAFRLLFPLVKWKCGLVAFSSLRFRSVGQCLTCCSAPSAEATSKLSSALVNGRSCLESDFIQARSFSMSKTKQCLPCLRESGHSYARKYSPHTQCKAFSSDLHWRV